MNHTHRIQMLSLVVRGHEATYQRAREREPALAAYVTGDALFEALAPGSALSSPARQPLLRAVVLAYQRERHPLWYALALCGFEPMLGALRARLRFGDADEREQEVQLAFVEAIGRLRFRRAGGPVFPLLTLRRSIARALHRRLDVERERARDRDDDVGFDQGAPGCLPSPHEPPEQYVHCLAREVGELVLRQPGGEDALRLLAGAETLEDQAERLEGTGETYRGLQSRQRRAVECVRRDLSRRRS